jgi:NTE family protein
MCAFVAWYALVTGQRERGPEMLAEFWDAIAASAPHEQAVNAATVGASGVQPDLIAALATPFFSALGSQQMRSALERVVDFDDPAARTAVDDLPLLLVSAVDVLSGEFTLFRNGEVGVDELLASSAVPGLYEPVEIGAGLYWDGLLSQNPPVRQLAWSRPDEIWVVQIYPRRRERAPRTQAEVRERRTELAANLSLEQEVWFVTRINELVHEGALVDPDHREIRVRRIELSEEFAGVSRLDRSPSILRELMAAGESAAERLACGA